MGFYLEAKAAKIATLKDRKCSALAAHNMTEWSRRHWSN